VRSLQAHPTTNAMIRTTTAPTILQAGTKDNVLPGRARAVVNFRILPGDTIDTVLAHVKATVRDDRIAIRPAGRFMADPSRVSDPRSDAFRRLEETLDRLAPDAIVAPYLVVVVTDARYYSDLSNNVFRFLPVRLGPDDLSRMHGTNERLGIRQYAAAIRTYRALMVRWTARQ
jgi:carboxypeptidase PM20D1